MPRLAMALMLAALSLAAAAGPCSAQDYSTAAARSLFDDGLRFVDQQQYAEAEDRFRRSLELRWSGPVAYNLALVEIERDNLFLALDLLRRVARDDGSSAEVRQAAREKVVELEPRMGRLSIQLVGVEDGVRVAIDGHRVPAPALGVPMPIGAGEHRLQAFRAGRQVAEQVITVTAGAEHTVELTIAPTPAEAAAALPVEPTERRRLSTGEAVAVTSTVVVMVAAAIVALFVQ